MFNISLISTKPRGEVDVKGKGRMKTFWVFGKKGSTTLGEIPQHMQAGVPGAATVPSLNRQQSQHSSLAAVVLGMMQTNRRSTRGTSITSSKY